MSRVPYTSEQLKKLGLIETDKGFVKASSLVAKHVEKFKNHNIIHLNQEVFDKEHIQGNGLPFPMKRNELKVNKKVKNATKIEENGVNIFKKKEVVTTQVLPNDGYFGLPNGELIEIKYSFDINPCPAPRMTRRDAIFLDPEHIDPNKRQRAAVTRYFIFKRTFTWLAQQNGFKLSETLRVIFIVPMPKYWNKKKREVNLYQPHKQRPDVDNFCKALMDSSGVDDGYVWDVRAIKLWGEKGQIIIF